jgi:hypothetical protein
MYRESARILRNARLEARSVASTRKDERAQSARFILRTTYNRELTKVSQMALLLHRDSDVLQQ